jgi:hypothetical protein
VAHWRSSTTKSCHQLLFPLLSHSRSTNIVQFILSVLENYIETAFHIVEAVFKILVEEVETPNDMISPLLIQGGEVVVVKVGSVHKSVLSSIEKRIAEKRFTRSTKRFKVVEGIDEGATWNVLQ